MAKERENTLLDEWKKLIKDFNDSVEKSLAEIRDCKRDIEMMKVELMNEVSTGQYFRDEDCIVISAPRIIIGNVNKDGNLKEEVGEIIIRGHAVDVNGVGTGGKITINAPVIEQKAIDTGLDGKEEVVHSDSQITSQARAIVLCSQDPTEDVKYKATFLDMPVAEPGILLHSEKDISVKAAPSIEKKKEWIDSVAKDIDAQITSRKSDITAKEQDAESKLKRLSNMLSNEKELYGDDDLTRTNVLAIDEIRATLKGELTQFNKLLLDYAGMVSDLAELTRKKHALKAESDHVTAITEEFKKDTGACINLQSESIDLFTMDGDDNWRNNEGAGVGIQANRIQLHSTYQAKDDSSESLTPEESKGRVDIQARNVNISTVDVTDHTFTDDHKLKTAKFPAVGNVTIRSKIIDLESVDLAQMDETGKLKEEALTAGSQINMRAEKVRVKTIDHQGKNVGKFSVNSKQISMKATDIDGYKPELELDSQGNRKQPASLPSKELAPGSEMLLLAETMRVGYKKNKMRSKAIFIASEEKTVLGSVKEAVVTTGKATMRVKEDAIEMAAKGAATYSADKGNTVIGESTFKGKVTGGDIVADNLTANKAVKAPNLTDGMVMSGPAEKGLAVNEEDMGESNL